MIIDLSDDDALRLRAMLDREAKQKPSDRAASASAPKIRGSGAVRVVTSRTGEVTIHVDPPPPREQHVPTRDLWLELGSATSIGASGTEIEYTARLYSTPYGNALNEAAGRLTKSGELVTAWNVAGYGNAATVDNTIVRQYGRAVTHSSDLVCGSISGHDGVPQTNNTKPRRYKVIGHLYREDRSKWGYLFDFVPDPDIHLT